MFYTKKCGAITAVTTEKHIKKKAAFAKAKYALVEFAHKDSVEVCHWANRFIILYTPVTPP